MVLDAIAMPYLLVAADAPRFTIVDANAAFVAAAALLAGAEIRLEDLVGRGYFELFFSDPHWLDDERYERQSA